MIEHCLHDHCCSQWERMWCNSDLVCSIADGVQYLRDTCLTLCYFLEAYPSGSQLLQQGQAGLITQLTSLHDDLVPQINKAATAASYHQKAQAAQVISA